METLVPLERWNKADKTGWHQLIQRWNRTKGFIKHIPSASYASTALMRPTDARKAKKDYQKAQRKPLYAPTVSWTEVMQRLPYRWNDDRTGMLVDNDFLDLLRLQKKIHSPHHA